MPVLILELWHTLAVVDSAAISICHKEDPVVHVIGDSGKMHVVEAAGRLIAKDEIEISSNHILWSCRSNFSLERHAFEGIGFENRQRGRPTNGACRFARFFEYQLAIGNSPGAGPIERPLRQRVRAGQLGSE